MNEIMKKLLPLFLILISGCVSQPKYDNQSLASTDPVIVFGDRLGGSAINSPARSFGVNTKDAASNKCADFEEVGTASNHWMRIRPRTIQIRTPTGKAVAIRGLYFYSSGVIVASCVPPALQFTPKEGARYSIDIEVINVPTAHSLAPEDAPKYSSVNESANAPPAKLIASKDASSYPVSHGLTHSQCTLSVVEQLSSGKQEKVDGLIVLPFCKDK
jgi:hypothetical protein